MNRMIKMQEEDYLLGLRQYDNGCFNNYLTTFYDHDTPNEIIQAKYSVHEVMSFLQQNLDICDTPINEILQFVIAHPDFKGVDIDLVKSKIIREKRNLKRSRAKNRDKFSKSWKYQPELIQCNEMDEEFKKKRNRISAQISRDRKKERVKELEELTKKLQNQCNQAKLENERLKLEIQESKKKQNFGQNSHQGGTFQPIKNSLTKLLIMLGVIFLLGVIKDIFQSERNQNIHIIKLDQHLPESKNYLEKANSLFNKENQMTDVSFLDKIEEPLSEMIEDKPLLIKVKDRIHRSFDIWKEEENWILPKKMKSTIRNIKNWIASS